MGSVVDKMCRRSKANTFSWLIFSLVLIFYIYKNGADAFKMKQARLQEDRTEVATTLLKTLYPGLNSRIYPALVEAFETFELLRQNESKSPRPKYSIGLEKRSVMKQDSNKARRSDLVNSDTMQEYGRVIKKRDWLTEWKRQAASKPNDVVEDLDLPGSWRIM